MKLIAIRTFSHGFFLYTTNDIVVLPDELAQEFIDKGFVKPYEDGFKKMVTKEEFVPDAILMKKSDIDKVNKPPDIVKDKPKPTRKKK